MTANLDVSLIFFPKLGLISLHNLNFLLCHNPTLQIHTPLLPSTCFSMGGYSCSWQQHVLWSVMWPDTLALSRKYYGLIFREGIYLGVQWEILDINVLSSLCTLRYMLLISLHTFLFAAFALELCFWQGKQLSPEHFGDIPSLCFLPLIRLHNTSLLL